MKKEFPLSVLFVIVNSVIISCSPGLIYKKDGIYEGRSRSRYTSEPFVAVSKVYIKKGVIQKIDFQITDTLNNELFDANYEKHFIGNLEYINQCRNDWNGIQAYPKELIKKQKMEYVDAVSGATWSYNMFKSSTEIALSKANE
jgi:major membrane immunogen (membrane-anchored lipoprotein)